MSKFLFVIFIASVSQLVPLNKVYAEQTLTAEDQSRILDIGEVREGVRHLSAEQTKQALASDPSIVVLDVRTAKEHQAGRIQAGENIDYYGDSFREQLAKLDRTKTYLVHCRSGVRSGRSLPILKSLGFTNLLHLDGGFKAWEELATDQ
jgi:Rhodanese-related sulfurtransferase